MSSFWSSRVMNVVRERLENLVDFDLNYGREVIRDFAREAAPLRVVLDVGAGGGDDGFGESGRGPADVPVRSARARAQPN